MHFLSSPASLWSSLCSWIALLQQGKQVNVLHSGYIYCLEKQAYFCLSQFPFSKLASCRKKYSRMSLNCSFWEISVFIIHIENFQLQLPLEERRPNIAIPVSLLAKQIYIKWLLRQIYKVSSSPGLTILCFSFWAMHFPFELVVFVSCWNSLISFYDNNQ